QNQDFVLKELGRMGIPADENAGMPEPTKEQTDEIEKLQVAAAEVAKLQLAQEQARGDIFVGYDRSPYQPPPPSTGSDDQLYLGNMATAPFIPVTFNPFKPPDIESLSLPSAASLLGVIEVETTPYHD